MDIKKARLCTRLSGLAYDDLSEKLKLDYLNLGITHVKFFDKDSSQGYVLHNETDVYVVFRGTELSEIKDIIHNGMMWPTKGQKQGRVHAGFSDATDNIWDEINSYLKGEVHQYGMSDNVIFTGHSLGGALAIIGAARCDYTADIYTFGSPRTGNRQYHANIKSRMFRITNEHDIIPLILPPIGYRHGGIEYRMFEGIMHPVSSYLDAWKWQMKIGFKKLFSFTWFRSLIRDHSIKRYIDHLDQVQLDVILDGDQQKEHLDKHTD